MLGAATLGFATAFSLILAIGAQNSLVLRHGLSRSHVFLICLFCAVSDAILIILGVAGFAAITAMLPSLPFYMGLAGALFLIAYGFMNLRAAWIGDYDAELEGKAKSLKQAIITIFAVTWLNPHVYLDTLALIGAVSTRYETVALKTAFGAGAVTSSFVFFFGLGYGARLLAPYMTSPRVWRGLDVGIAMVMFAIAYGLLVKVVF